MFEDKSKWTNAFFLRKQFTGRGGKQGEAAAVFNYRWESSFSFESLFNSKMPSGQLTAEHNSLATAPTCISSASLDKGRIDTKSKYPTNDWTLIFGYCAESCKKCGKFRNYSLHEKSMLSFYNMAGLNWTRS